MDEPLERQMYRMECKHYGVNGGCLKQSREQSRPRTSPWGVFQPVFFIDIACTSDCNCRRMKRYDKLKKNES